MAGEVEKMWRTRGCHDAKKDEQVVGGVIFKPLLGIFLWSVIRPEILGVDCSENKLGKSYMLYTLAFVH